MIESIIEWSIRNRMLVILAAIAIAIAGGRAMLRSEEHTTELQSL